MTDPRRCMATCISRRTNHEYRCQLARGHRDSHYRTWKERVKTGWYSTEEKLFSVSWFGTYVFVGPAHD